MKRGFIVKAGLMFVSVWMAVGTAVMAQDLGPSGAFKVTLDDAIRVALTDNPTIKVAEQQIEVKKISKDEAWQALLPSVDFSGTIQYTVLAAVMKLNGMEFKMGQDNTSTWNGQFQVSLPVFAPTVYATMNLTKTDLDNAVEQSRSSKLDLVNQVTKAYYQVILAQDSYDVLCKSLEQAQRNFDVVKSLYELGGTSEYDKISAEVQLRSLNPTVIQARNAVTLAKLQLMLLMGIDPETEITVEGSLEDYEDRLYGEALGSGGNYSLENNTNMRQLRMNETMLNQTLRVQKMNFLPTMALAGTYSMQSLYNDNWNVFDYSWAKSSSIVLSLSLPIFRMGNFTKLRSTKLQISQLNENIGYTEKQLNMQVRSYVDNMKANAEQVASNREAIEQAEKGREIASKRYEIGKGTILELNNSEVSLTQAKLTYSQSIYNYLAAKADLDKVLGDDAMIPDVK
ncbi:MAG: TolC family protein [Bacteroidaceae bacterium]|nr:TolC family protein [Bacteroidaceae bacterium]